MKGSQAELIGFLRRFAAAYTDGGDPPSVRVIRKPQPIKCVICGGQHDGLTFTTAYNEVRIPVVHGYYVDLVHGRPVRPAFGQCVYTRTTKRQAGCVVYT